MTCIKSYFDFNGTVWAEGRAAFEQLLNRLEGNSASVLDTSQKALAVEFVYTEYGAPDFLSKFENRIAPFVRTGEISGSVDGEEFDHQLANGAVVRAQQYTYIPGDEAGFASPLNPAAIRYIKNEIKAGKL